MARHYGQHIRWVDKEGYSHHGTFIKKTLIGKYLVVKDNTKHKIKEETMEWYYPEAYPLNLSIKI